MGNENPNHEPRLSRLSLTETAIHLGLLAVRQPDNPVASPGNREIIDELIAARELEAKQK